MAKGLAKTLEASYEIIEQRIAFLNAAVSDPKVMAGLGLFVVYEQLLEQKIKSILTVAYSHKSIVVKDGITLISSVPLDRLILGALIAALKQISFYEGVGQNKRDLMKPFLGNLESFNKTRNNYIHKLLEGTGGFSIKDLESGLFNVAQELDDLLKQADQLKEKMDKHLGLDGGSIVRFADSLFDKS